MAADPRKRQKKLQRRTAKRQEKKHHLVRQQSLGLGGQLAAAARFSILHSWVMGGVFGDKGMGQVLVSRALPNGSVAVGVFLLDRLCLGVKDAFGEILPRSEYDEKFVRQGESRLEVDPVAPALARKLVEEAVAYARDLGFSPHPDYQKARLIFGDIDVSECTEKFEFGKDGKPLFIAGPYDSPQRCRFIMNLLTRRCGPGKFDCIMPLAGTGARLHMEPAQGEGNELDYHADEDMDDFDEDE